MAKPLVTAVIPAYNCEKYIGGAIESILSQDYEPVEVVVADDGSTDGTRDIVSSFGKRVELVECIHGGPSAARNAGIAAAKGDLIAFLDADDLWKPGKLSYQVPLFEDPQVGFVYSNFDYIDAQGKLIRTRLGRWHKGNIFREIMKYGLAWTGTVIVRRSVFEHLGGFDESMPVAEDWDMWLRISAYYEADYDIRTLSSYRMHEESLLGRLDFIDWMVHSLKKNFEAHGKHAGISRTEYRRILAHYYYRLGNGVLPGKLAMRNRHYLWQAIKTYPLHFKALRAYFWGLCAYWRARKSGAIGLDYLNR
jgi:glycosyltransferase involved in cell wall biosynthesis